MTNQVKHFLCLPETDGVRVILLHQDSYVIGRDKHSDILLCSKTVSRHHARLTRVTENSRTEDGYRIIDGNANGQPSSNGIMVNEQRCASHCLRSGDQIMIGNVQALYYIEQALPLYQMQSLPAAQLQQVADASPPINPKITLTGAAFPEALASPANHVSANPAEEDDDLPATMLFRKS